MPGRSSAARPAFPGPHWQRLTGEPLPAAALELGYRWVALQIPVQYLPWTVAHRSACEVEAALDRIERALGQLPS